MSFARTLSETVQFCVHIDLSAFAHNYTSVQKSLYIALAPFPLKDQR